MIMKPFGSYVHLSIWALIHLLSVSRGGLLMDTLEIPAPESHVWQLADSAEHRYAKGWHLPDVPIAEVLQSGPARFEPSPLRLRGTILDIVSFSTSIWRAPSSEQLGVVEQILFLWSLQVPVYPSGAIPLRIRERMFLVPRQVRIDLAPAAVEVEERN